METQKFLKETQGKMAKAVEHSLHSFSRLHTGKASPTMVENVLVDAYGSMMKLKEVAAITTPDPRMILVQPWDKGLIKAVEKAIQAANVGLNPAVDGGMVRCPIPELSRERRAELAKSAHAMAEEGRVSIRSVRREVIEAIKKAQKGGILSEDDTKRLEKEIQQLTDKAIKDIDGHLANKEKELMRL